MGFWIAALAVSTLVVLALARPLALSRHVLRPRAAHEEQVFRDQLAEIDRDLERGVLDPEEAASARLEVSRRLLAAATERAAAAGLHPAPRRASLALAVLLVAAAPLGAVLLYRALGAPDLPDQPLALRAEGARPSQSAAEARTPEPLDAELPAEAAARLAELEARRKAGTIEPAELYDLARGYGALGLPAEAWRAYAELIDGRVDAPATLYAALGENMVLAASGYVSPEAQAAFEDALRRDPAEPVARYYLGAALAQTRRPQGALEIWSRLLADSAADAPWRTAVEARIAELVERTGLTPPEGFSETAARAPDPEARREAILGMVERLDDRLGREGGGAEAWARVVASWRVLGREDRADAAEARAREALAGDAATLEDFEAALAAARAQAEAAAALQEEATALQARVAAGEATPEDWAALVTARLRLGGPPAAREAASRARDALGPEAREAFEARLAKTAPGLATAEDVAAMAPQERTAMIRGMVDRLRDRLHAEGGDAEAWARLVRSLAVLGRRDEAKAALARGLAALGEAEAAPLLDEARAAGIAAE